MDKWLDAFAKWPPSNQLIFSCVAVIAALVVLFLFGIWMIQMMRYVAVAVRGWPPDERDDQPARPAPPSVSSEDMATFQALLEELRRRPILVGPSVAPSTPGGSPLAALGIDWKEEQRRLMEEQELRKRADAHAKEMMEQIPCTDGIPVGHTSKGEPPVPRTPSGLPAAPPLAGEELPGR